MAMFLTIHSPGVNYRFDNKPGKYRLVQAEKTKRSKKLKKLKFELESKVPSKLPTYVQDLMREVVRLGQDVFTADFDRLRL